MSTNFTVGPADEQAKGRQAIVMNLRYHDGLVAFKKRCTDYPSIRQFMTDAFKKDIMGIRTFMRGNQDNTVADIGCGDGTITEHLAGILARTFSGRVLLDIIEPTENYIEQTSERIAKFTGDAFGINFHRQKAEEFFSDAPAQRYDLVFASHSLHLIPLEGLKAIVPAVKDGGYFVVVIGAKTSIMSVLKDLFMPAPAITGSDILQEVQTRFPELEAKVISQPSHLDLRGVDLPENKDGLTEEARNLLSLMVQKNIDDVDQEGYMRARKLILERTVDGRLRLDNDCIIFKRR